MRPAFLPALAVLALLALAGCDSPERTSTSLRRDLDAYSQKPEAATAARIEADFVRLAGQIDELRAAGRQGEADTWQQELDALRLRFAAAKMAGNIQNMKQAAENLGQAFRQAGQTLGEAFKDQDEPPPR
jgi:hypothetical protein